MKVGDLVKVITEGLRPQIGGVGLVTKMQTHTDSLGSVLYCYAQMAEPGSPIYKFRVEYLEVISASR